MSSHPVRPALLPALVWFVLGTCLCASAQQTHVVDVGLSGIPQFTDRDTGATSQNGRVSTFVRPGDTVQWVFHYVHSTTSGNCPNNACEANGVWDSQIQDVGFVFSRRFDQAGVFPYFCRVHLSAMQGQIVVGDEPDYILALTGPNQFSPTMRTAIVLTGQPGTFSGNITGFFGYTNQVNLTCANGTPRNPDICPPAVVFPDGSGHAIPFSFSVSDSAVGDYLFDLTAVGTDPRQETHAEQVRLVVQDFILTQPSTTAVTLLPNASSAPIEFQVTAAGGFVGGIQLVCDNQPVEIACTFMQNGVPTGQVFVNSITPTQNVALTISNSTAAPGSYAVEVTGVSMSPFFLPARRSQLISLSVIGSATRLEIASPATVISGNPFPVTVKARDAANQQVPNYIGTVRFSGTDPAAALPANTTFSLSDNGVRNFSVTFNSLGPRVVAVNDVSSPQIQSQSPIIIVQPSAPANNTIVLLSDRGPGNQAFFHNEAVNVEIRVSGASTPTGKVHLYDGLAEITPPGGLTLSPLNATTARAIVPTLHMRPGGHQLTVVYDGDPPFEANVSGFSQQRSPAPRCANNVCPGSH